MPNVAQIRRFCGHLWGCFVKAKETDLGAGDWAAFLGPILAILGTWLVPLIPGDWLKVARDFFHQYAWVITWLSVSALVIRGFWHSFVTYDKLSETMKPQFDIQCGPEISGCCVPSQFIDGSHNMFHRMAITATCQQRIHDCRAFITRIEKDGNVKMGTENLAIPFAPGEPETALSVTLIPNVTSYLDVLYTTDKNTVMPRSKLGKEFGWPNAVNPLEIFSEKGEYILTVVLSSQTQSRESKLSFNWTGNWTTASMRLV